LTWFREKLQDLADMLPFSEPKDRGSPLRGLAESGQALVENMMKGMDFSPLHAALQVELAKTQGALAGAVGNLNVDQTFTGDWVFPNVRDGRDAGSIRQGIDRQALEAGMAARTGGG
jgi:hypothetical protein